MMPDNAVLQRVGEIERKLDGLSTSVDARFEQVDQRFEQVDKRFEQVDKRFDEIDARFDDIEKRFIEVRDHFVEQREYIEFAYDRLDRRMSDGFAGLDSRITATKQELSEGLSRVERKLDQFIDSQSSARVTTRRARSPKRRR